ncbi:MAG: hypothetical protein A3H57_03860 [Candidatus Taylorbacteria bacterium RIFCSPLOWO2_02_FULL_43_11]|uniref:Protein TolB n=1 Tax=Candidatus Taylorbacteria bacterium RIFCSPHIGHO2_02_FULL_43_32b TaxID=1802306 RepID=A0A1G2MK10_9BACT|nr:MAG: hypothetical protein A2743_01335 [Candidatus Taylorbacteria bacterium RIFCSPHIGHO2_01_FULL_43_47]OHA24064.1 MAG: hypothetical protein A3C72_02930 [Candidatus Taylorbacteria bacterium RIFCSPHIGHO2_02_FULL_43_32b]OHA31472.1 MAG: hypothetical protein A3B08_00815 [Candidatus Taylorbacteria bacterium RIFCSPLOWO2_01_FULL_43_44]OHA37523.1 MAG: hypothetical protein A3H57_03860 [Candidatus Taylorbacteria bacterium RIFCSPLOWO2_02_FULL_43_11]
MENKKSKIIITVLVVVLFLIVGALFFLFFINQEEAGDPGDIFPGSGSDLPDMSTSTTSGGGRSGTTQGGGNLISGIQTPHPRTGTAFKPVLRLVTNKPVGGAVTFERSGKVFIRYIERAQGFTFETSAVNINNLRLTNTTVPQIYSALFNANGTIAILQYLKDESLIQTFVGNLIEKGGGQGELRGQFLKTDISTLALSPQKDKVFYLLETNSGSSGELVSLNNTQRSTEIFESPLRQWLSQWPTENKVLLYSKPSYNSEGVALFVNTVSAETTTILGGIKGLTALASPEGNHILYSNSSDKTMSTRIYRLNDNSSKTISLTTLPEKCIWSDSLPNVFYCAVPSSIPKGNYPDQWYQGTISFRDEMWKVNAETGDLEYLSPISDLAGMDIDAVNLSIDKKDKSITFMNKNDLSLWTLQIAE